MTLRAWAELLRVSALFTVPGDALAGAASAGVRPNRGTALAVGASLCLYEAGMALNDWADREEDARERPHRPIPSGRISPNAALTAAGGLTAAGLFLASRAGRPALALTGALTVAVWAYDLKLKHTAAGPVAMGAARALDVLLGAAATTTAASRAASAGTRETGPARNPASRPLPRTGGAPDRTAAGPAPGSTRPESSATRWAAPVLKLLGRSPQPPAPTGAPTGLSGRLPAWAGGSSAQARTAVCGPTEPLASRPAGPAHGTGSTPCPPPFRTDAAPSPAGLSAWTEACAQVGRAVAATGLPAPGAPELLDCAGPAGAPARPADRSSGLLALLSTWADASSPNGRSAPLGPAEPLASHRAGPGRHGRTVHAAARPGDPAVTGAGLPALLSAWAAGLSADRRAGPPPGRLPSALPAWFPGSSHRTPAAAAGPLARLLAGLHRTHTAGRAVPPAPGTGPWEALTALAAGSAAHAAHAARRSAARPGGTLPAAGGTRRALVPAALLGAHTVAVTAVSRREVYGGSTAAPLAALALTGVLGGLVGRPVRRTPPRW